MRLEVRLFAGLREAAGSDHVGVEVEEGCTVEELLETLRRMDELPELAGLLERLPVRVAVNMAYAEATSVLAAGDEIALIPPISGGSQISVRVGPEPLEISRLAAEAGDPAAGAVVVFQGVTREVESLEYEAYVEMAERRIAAILADCVEHHGLTGAVAGHRTGRVGLGEPSVIVAVSAPHRPEAFAGARDAIDRIKAEAPVWKTEVEADGSRERVEGVQPEADSTAEGRRKV